MSTKREKLLQPSELKKCPKVKKTFTLKGTLM